MQQGETGNLAAITEANTREALRALRYAKSLAGSPLIGLAQIESAMAREGLEDTLELRSWLLHRRVDELCVAALARARGRTGLERPALAPEPFLEAMIEDFRAEDIDREAWSTLCLRHVVESRVPNAELADRLGVTSRTVIRRLGRGYALLADQLRDRELAALQEAEPPRDERGAPTAPAGAAAPGEGLADAEPETRSALLELRAALLAGGSPEILAPAALALAARHPAGDLEAQRLTRIATWSAPRYRVDTRFVELSLLVDQGEAAAAGRWQVARERFAGLASVLEALEAPALVLLGAPGAGKSTLLRRLEVDVCRAGLSDAGAPVTFLVALSGYAPEPELGLPPPRRWLAELWQQRHPQLPPLERYLSEGRMLLLLDGLNEMPHRDLAEHREQVAAWKRFLQESLAGTGNRALFSCRSLDYSAPLSTPELRVPQARVEPLDEARMRAFVEAYAGAQAAALWAEIAASPQRELLRRPYLLRLLIESHETGQGDRTEPAALLTGLVRRALRRELERDHPALAAALAERDLQRVVSARRWRDPWELPERGPLVPGLEALAHAMQTEHGSEDGRAVRLPFDEALDLIGGEAAESVVEAGLALALLDEDRDRDELMFFHQLIQEYFAARRLARRPEPERAGRAWRAERVQPPLAELIASLGPGEPLPPLPGSGWSESCRMAAVMMDRPTGFLRDLAEADLALAGRAAAQPALAERLEPELRPDLCRRLADRSRDPRADLRARIEAGRTLGQLGDPRFEARRGPDGDFLLPPLVEISGGRYPIGDDQPLRSVEHRYHSHIPAHQLEIPAFAIGRFAVTNAEWAAFMTAGGYEDPRWWEGEPARAWRRGEGTDEDARQNNREWREHFQKQPARIERFLELGTFDEATAERWRRWASLEDARFELELAERWPGRRLTEPRFWRDPRLGRPTDPVVGICWFEARAYCCWLSAQSGRPFRLPREVEWEAAARGPEGRAFPYGQNYRPLAGNTTDAHLFGPSPVGVFPEGDSPEGVSDLSGNTWDWTSSAWGPELSDAPRFGYPYDPDDGREDPELPPETVRIARGGAWNGAPAGAHAVNRNPQRSRYRADDIGLRVALSLDQPV